MLNNDTAHKYKMILVIIVTKTIDVALLRTDYVIMWLVPVNVRFDREGEFFHTFLCHIYSWPTHRKVIVNTRTHTALTGKGESSIPPNAFIVIICLVG